MLLKKNMDLSTIAEKNLIMLKIASIAMCYPVATSIPNMRKRVLINTA